MTSSRGRSVQVLDVEKLCNKILTKKGKKGLRIPYLLLTDSARDECELVNVDFTLSEVRYLRTEFELRILFIDTFSSTPRLNSEITMGQVWPTEIFFLVFC